MICVFSFLLFLLIFVNYKVILKNKTVFGLSVLFLVFITPTIEEAFTNDTKNVQIKKKTLVMKNKGLEQHREEIKQDLALEKQNDYYNNSELNLLLNIAVKKGDIILVSKLITNGNINLNSKDSNGTPALIRSIKNNDTEMVKQLIFSDYPKNNIIRENIDLTIKDDTIGLTPLEWASQLGSDPEIITILRGIYIPKNKYKTKAVNYIPNECYETRSSL